jgi:hypothetical protein
VELPSQMFNAANAYPAYLTRFKINNVGVWKKKL